MAAVSSAIDVVTAAVPPGSRIIDIGCGSGSFAAALAAEGYRVAGVEPQEARVAEGRRRAPQADLRVAGAEALPFADAAFDAAVMIHSLHHVPLSLMRPALLEALRCTAADGALIVVEPLAAGSFNAVFRLIDDEAEIRRAAQDALEDACRDGLMQRVATFEWQEHEVYATADDLIRSAAAVDPARAERAAALRSEIAQAMARHGSQGLAGWSLAEPIRADVFRR